MRLHSTYEYNRSNHNNFVYEGDGHVSTLKNKHKNVANKNYK